MPDHDKFSPRDLEVNGDESKDEGVIVDFKTAEEDGEEGYADIPIQVVYKHEPPKLQGILKQRSVSECSSDESNTTPISRQTSILSDSALSEVLSEGSEPEDYQIGSGRKKCVSFCEFVDRTMFKATQSVTHMKGTLKNKRKRAKKRERRLSENEALGTTGRKRRNSSGTDSSREELSQSKREAGGTRRRFNSASDYSCDDEAADNSDGVAELEDNEKVKTKKNVANQIETIKGVINKKVVNIDVKGLQNGSSKETSECTGSISNNQYVQVNPVKGIHDLANGFERNDLPEDTNNLVSTNGSQKPSKGAHVKNKNKDSENKEEFTLDERTTEIVDGIVTSKESISNGLDLSSNLAFQLERGVKLLP